MLIWVPSLASWTYPFAFDIKISFCSEVVLSLTDVIRFYLDAKIKWLLKNIVRLTSKGSVLVFVTRKADSVLVHEECKKHGYKTKVLHGDMHQAERNDVISGK